MVDSRALLVVIISVFSQHEALGRAVDYASCTDLGVSVTVSSLVETSTPRQLELSWWQASPLGGDFVGLYDSDPSNGAVEPLVTIAVNASSGYGLTEVQAPVTMFSQLAFTARCLEYWVAYVRSGNQIMATSCLRTQPTWMSDMRGVFGDMILREMFLPGTHNTCSYRKFTDIGSETVSVKNAYTQEEDILSQLVHGIRYLDIRAAHYVNTEELWWTNHGPVRLVPMKSVTAQVKQFLDNTDEIVIFDIHELTGFGDTMEIHNAFVSWLSTELDGYMMSPTVSWSATLNTMWATDQRLIVTYNNQQVINSHNNLWTTVQQKWANVRDVEALYNYLAGVIASPPQFRAWSAMVQLTATPADVVSGALGGLRKMADSVNRNVTVWFRGAWGKLGLTVDKIKHS